MSLKPWPEEALPLCKAIQYENDQIEALIKICLSEGIHHQNYQLIETLLPKIERRANRIKECCKQIQTHVPRRRRGRDPKWAVITLEISAQAMQLLRCCELITEQIPANRWITVAHVLEIAAKIAVKVAANFDILPCGDGSQIDIPAAFYQAFDNDDD